MKSKNNINPYPKSFESIYKISPYIGGDITPKGFVRDIVLASNENPYGCSLKIKEVLNNYFQIIHTYPSGNALNLRQKIAQTYGLNSDMIITGNGSEDILHLLAKAFATNGDEIIIPEHGFGVYKIAALSVGATPIIVKRNNFVLESENILKAITSKTKIIYLDHPGNPIANFLKTDELENLINKIPANVLIVLDAAYAEYMEDFKDYNCGIDLVNKYENVVMTRSFSKAFGMANLRLGFLYANNCIIDPINRIRAPFNTTGISQLSGIAALDDLEHIKKSIALNKENFLFFKNGLEELEIEHLNFFSNFIMAKFNNSDEVYNYLGRNGVIVRPMKAYDLPQYLRITISKKEHMKKCLELLKNFF